MYLTIGKTKLLIGQYGEGKSKKLEINFDYLFSSHSSYRRFAQIIANNETFTLKIKIKTEFTNVSDCSKLAQLLVGVKKLATPENLNLLNNILESSSSITPQNFIQQQEDLTKYFL